MCLTVYGMNKRLFEKIYFCTINNKWAEKAAIFTSEFSKPAFVIIYLLGIIAVLVQGGEGIVKIIAVPFFTLVFNTVLRKILNKPRPFMSEGITKLVEHEQSGSFPSNHACSSMIISLSYFLVLPVAVPFFIVLAFFTGLSRVMTGVHYPVDVCCGWLISIISGCIFFLLL